MPDWKRINDSFREDCRKLIIILETSQRRSTRCNKYEMVIPESDPRHEYHLVISDYITLL